MTKQVITWTTLVATHPDLPQRVGRLLYWHHLFHDGGWDANDFAGELYRDLTGLKHTERAFLRENAAAVRNWPGGKATL